MVLRPEDRGKAAALGAAVVLVGGFIVFRVVSDSAGPPPKEAGPVEAIGGNSAVGAAKTAVSDTNAATQKTVNTASGTNPAALPVNPPAATGGQPGTQTATGTPKATGDIEVPSMYANNTADPFRSVIQKPTTTTAPPPKQIFTSKGSGTGSVGPVDPIGKGAPPEMFVMPDIKVMGVITGEDEVAVLKIGDRNYIAHVGDSIGGGMTLRKITRSGISVRSGKQTFEVPIQ
ncbi:MAG: hypothetical protein JSS65_06680 [Armatimonadetes bacterium]|nr:hypothetical protein [Armatimonadota bacterium]